MSFVNKDRLDELSSLAHNLAEDYGLLEEEHLQFFKFFGLQFAQICTAVELAMEQ
jgi:hypothetical protein